MKLPRVLSNRDLRNGLHAFSPGKVITWRVFMMGWLIPLSLLASPISQAEPIESGRLFYTPAQRVQLESARARNLTQRASPKQRQNISAPAPLRFDGIVIRSDGKSTRWVDGKAEVGTSSVTGLKPGQIRANGKVYEPYQVLRPQAPSPIEPAAKEPTP
ncbi:MAG: hypothetical protein Q8K52_08160 [Thiobacillus sp.]|nr:hypothetical protein [Thiobacillus sp.]